MKIFHLINNFIYKLFNVEEGESNELLKKVQKYYSINGMIPNVSISDNILIIDIDNNQKTINQNSFNSLIKYCENKQFDKAYPLACELALQNPTNSEIFRIKGQLESDMGHTDKAIDSLIDSLRWDSKNTYALIMMGNIFARDKNDIETAMKYFEQASISDPNDNISINNIGANLLNLGKYSEAKIFFKKAEKLNSNYSNTKFALAFVYFEEKKYHQSFDYVLEVLRLTKESDSLFQQSISLAFEIAKKLNENKSIDNTINEALNNIKELTGKEIIIEADNSIPTTAKVELAENYNRDYHLIKYKPNSPGVFHLILHELQHIEFAEVARLADHHKLFISRKQHRFKFINDFESYALFLQKKGYPETSISNVINSLFDGLNRQVYNTPIDLFIEDKIYNNYPEIRPIQFVSLYSILMEGRDAVTRKEIVDLTDPKILSKSKIYNLVLANHFKDLYQIDYLKSFKGSTLELNSASSMYSEFIEYRNDREPGEEYELVQNWGNDLNLSKYFELISENDYYQTNNNSLETFEIPEIDKDTDANQKIEMHEFLENHQKEDLNPAVLMFMIGALEYFKKLSLEEIKKIAFQIATIGMNGINPQKKEGYIVPLIPNSNFSGYQMLAYYYVSFALSSPQILPELQLPFEKEFETAKTFVK